MIIAILSRHHEAAQGRTERTGVVRVFVKGGGSAPIRESVGQQVNDVVLLSELFDN